MTNLPEAWIDGKLRSDMSIDCGRDAQTALLQFGHALDILTQTVTSYPEHFEGVQLFEGEWGEPIDAIGALLILERGITDMRIALQHAWAGKKRFL